MEKITLKFKNGKEMMAFLRRLYLKYGKDAKFYDIVQEWL